MALDLATIGLGMETSGLEKGQAALKQTEQAANKAADAADRASGRFTGLSESSDKTRSASERLTQRINDQIGKLERQATTFGMSASQAQLYKMATDGATAAQIKQADAAMKSIEAQEKNVRALKDARDAGEAFGSAMKVGAIAIVAGLTATAVAFEKLIGNIANYQDLAEKTGADPAGLAALRTAADVGGTSVEALGAAANRLQTGLSKVDDESKGVGRALQAIGINVQDFKKLSPEVQLREIAKGLNQYADGGGKVAVIQAILGRGSAELLPAMKELGNEQEAVNRLTKEQIGIADDYKDAQARARSEVMQMAEVVAVQALPAVTKMTGAFKDSIVEVLGLGKGASDLQKTEAIQTWAKDAGTTLSYLVDIGQIVIGVLRAIGKVAGAQLAVTGEVFGTILAAYEQVKSGNFSGAWDALKSGAAGVKSVVGSVKEDLAGLMDEKLLGSTFRDNMAKNAVAVKGVGDAADKTKPSLNGFTAAQEKSSQAAKAAAAQYESLLLSIKERIAVAQEELSLGRKLTDSDKQAIKLNELLESSKSKLNATQRAALITKSEEARIDEARVKFMVENAAAHDRMREALNADVAVSEKAAATLTDQNKTLRDEIELIGLSEAAQHAITQARGEAIILIKEQELATITAADNELETMSRRQIALAAEIEQLRERNQLTGAKFDKTTVAKAADDANKEWSKFTDDIEKGLTDSLYRGFEAGKGFFKSFWDGIKNLFKTTVLKLAVQGVMTGVTGTASGLANAAGGGGGIGGLLGNVGGLFGGGSAGGILDLLGSTGLGTLDFGGISLAGLSNGAGMLAKAIPYVGWAVAAVTAITALVKKFDTSGTPHVGQLAEYSAAGGLKTSQKHGDFGMGFGGVDYNEGAATLVQGISKTIVSILDSTAKAFGKAAGYSVATGFADDSSKDGAWGGLLIKQMENVLVNWSDSRSSKWAPKVFADGEAGQKEYLAAVSKDLLGVLKGMDLAGWANDVLNALGDTPALEDLAKAIDYINSVKSALEVMGKNIVGFAGYSDAAAGALIKASGGISNLATNAATFYDLYYSEEEKRANATRDVTAALAAVNVELPTSEKAYRALVEQYTAMGTEGAATLAVLLGLAGAFHAITPAAEAVGETLDKALARLRNPVRTVDDVAGNIIGLEDKVFQAENAGNVAALRERELKGLTDTEKALVRRLHALEDEAAAIAKATAIASERTGLENELLNLLGETGELRRRERAALDESNRAIYDSINAEKDRQAAIAAAAAVANERTGLENQLLTLLGKTGELRARERAALDESNRALYDAVKAEEDRQAAIAKATAVANERAGIEREILALNGDTAAIRALELAGLDAANRALKEHYYALVDEKAAAEAAAQAAATIANEKKSLEQQLLQLTGDTVAIRAAERAALDESNRALYDHINAIKDEQAAASAAAAALTAAANEHAGLQERLWQIQGNSEALRKAALDKLLDDESRRMQQEIWAAEDVAAAQARAQQAAQEAANYAQQAAQDQLNAAKQIKDAWQGVSDSLVDEIKRIRGEMVGGGQVGYAQSQAQFAIALAQANAGDQDAMKSLPALSKAMLDLAQTNAGSMVELRAIQAATAASLEAANGRIVGQYGLAVPSLDVGTNNVPHDMLLMAHAGEAIVPRAYNPALGGSGGNMNTARLEVLVEMLTAKVDALTQAAEKTRDNTKGIDEKLSRVTQGGDSVRTEAVAA